MLGLWEQQLLSTRPLLPSRERAQDGQRALPYKRNHDSIVLGKCCKCSQSVNAGDHFYSSTKTDLS